MNIHEKIFNWLRTWPGFPGDQPFMLEKTLGNQESWGLFPMGTQILSAQEDVLGNRREKVRQTYVLRHIVSISESDRTCLLTDLEQWIQQQNGKRCIPTMGQVRSADFIKGEKAHRSQLRSQAMAVYEMILTAEYENYYEVIESGKN